MRSVLRFLLAAVAASSLLTACGGGDVSPNAGEVRLVNATGEFGTLDLYEDTDRLSAGVFLSTSRFVVSGLEVRT